MVFTLEESTNMRTKGSKEYQSRNYSKYARHVRFIAPLKKRSGAAIYLLIIGTT